MPGGKSAKSSGTGGGEARRSLSPAYLILGDDEPKVELALRRLRARIVEESGTELNIDEFRAGDHPAREAVAAANTLAFLEGIRLVLVHDAQAWRKPDKEEIAAYLESPAPDACLTLVGTTLPPKDPLRKAFQKKGEVLEYRAPKSWELPEWTLRQAKKLGVGLGTAEAKLLVERAGAHQQSILRELEKLLSYKGRARVTADDVELLVPRTLEARVFDLVDAVVDGHGYAAFTIVEDLYGSGEKPNGLFYRLLRHYQQLSRVLALREEGWPQAQIQSELQLKPYPAKKLFKQAGNYSVGRVRAALGHLAETDARMKGQANIPAEFELELCLGRLLALREG